MPTNPIRPSQHHMDITDQLFGFWHRQKVLTLPELTQRLQSSVRTVRRRLKAWKGRASFNKNGRYYTLPDIPQFDAQGLWFYQQIGFSRHGNLPQTIVALVSQSPAGLTAGELGRLLHLDPRSFLWPFHRHPALQRQKFQGQYVYFALDSDAARRQSAQRSAAAPLAPLPTAAEAVAILVRTMQHPRQSPAAIAAAVRSHHPQVTEFSVRALFAHHGLALKKTPPAAG